MFLRMGNSLNLPNLPLWWFHLIYLFILAEISNAVLARYTALIVILHLHDTRSSGERQLAIDPLPSVPITRIRLNFIDLVVLLVLTFISVVH